ncbi:unnamed protein product [marine sediment metagenome]|uniref:Uncharacterized protein n=1 Tax=marine sediment metagenome TaxID=412755 RepID=X0YSK0_9ZZZZ
MAERTDVAVKKTRLVEIAKWIDYQYDVLGRTTGISDGEMITQVLLHVPEAAVPAFINKEHRLSGEARVSADDCGPIIGWLQDEKKKRKREAREQGGGPPAGVSRETMRGLVAQHLPHLYS